MSNIIETQERYKFLENPEQYLKDTHKKWKEFKLRTLPEKKWYYPKSLYCKKIEKLKQSIEERYNELMHNVKKDAIRISQPTYVYYKGEKLKVPSDFYYNYEYADIGGYLYYLEEEDKRKHVITEEDREKARLLDCNLDYNYLQTLMNKLTNNPDLVITVKTKDNAVITLRNNKKLDNDVMENEVFVQPTLVR